MSVNLWGYSLFLNIYSESETVCSACTPFFWNALLHINEDTHIHTRELPHTTTPSYLGSQQLLHRSTEVLGFSLHLALVMVIVRRSRVFHHFLSPERATAFMRQNTRKRLDVLGVEKSPDPSLILESFFFTLCCISRNILPENHMILTLMTEYICVHKSKCSHWSFSPR